MPASGEADGYNTMWRQLAPMVTLFAEKADRGSAQRNVRSRLGLQRRLVADVVEKVVVATGLKS